MRPVIINKNSDFVVITYWWGRGNKNKNTQLPCPEDLEEGENLIQKPITYNKMIADWKSIVRKAKCNYLAVEYPAFAKKGMYQRAINYKPQFILEALKACYPRAVVYIDGDMKIKRYPRIFDISDVDFMSQGWNSDLRYHLVWQDAECYYPYVFETSGGTMYFNNTPQAKVILQKWKESIHRHPLKAEDRLISQIFNQQKMLLETNTIQLPVEYLWLDLEYEDYIPKQYWSKNQIYISHPACLTGEERAFAEGAAQERFPARYSSQVTDQVRCYIKHMPFYEYIFFPNKSAVNTMSKYLEVMNRSKLINLVKYDKKYGVYNSVYNSNAIKMRSIKIQQFDGLVHLCTKGYQAGKLRNIHRLERISDLIPTAIKYLRRGNDIVFIPNAASVRMASRVKKIARDLKMELLCRNKNTRQLQYKKEYTLVIDRTYPMYFSAGSSVLLDLLSMSKTLPQVGQHFRDCFIFLSRIRCKWV